MNKALNYTRIIGICVLVVVSLIFREINVYTRAAWIGCMLVLAMGSAYNLKSDNDTNTVMKYVGMIVVYTIIAILGAGII